MDEIQLEKINKFTRRPLTEDEVYVFSVILCDNEIDRDGECFSDTALEEICEKFIGKTGILDYNLSTSNQTARIFDTELVTDESRVTKYNADYKYVKANAYMVKTDKNRNLIAEIEGGHTKEVSISCSAAKRICSICGCDKNENDCSHIKGKSYDYKQCCTILSDITDAYEWSFVEVPARNNTKEIKSFESDNVNHPSHYNTGKYECIDEMIALFGIEAVKDFCRCNAFKYRYRAGNKNGENAEKDMAKCEWYVSKLMELENNSGSNTRSI